MHIKLKDIKIPTNYTFKYDKLNRQESIMNMKQFIDEINKEPFVLAIDSSYGMGKSTFLKMMKSHFEPKYCIIEYDAWENDLYEDIFITIVAEITKQIETFLPNDKTGEILNELKDKGSKIAINLISFATRGIIDRSLWERESSEYIDRIERYYKIKKEFKDFKKALTNVANSVYKETKKPLIITIDELDRCKPIYAIKLLEIMKHLFSINHIVFILAVDKQHLINSIKSIYGSEIDANGYLGKFIDFYYYLPDPNYELYINFLIKSYGLESVIKTKMGKYEVIENELIESAKYLIKRNRFNLREINQYFIHLVICMLFINKPVIPIHLALLLYLRMKEQKEYTELKTRNRIGDIGRYFDDGNTDVSSFAKASDLYNAHLGDGQSVANKFKKFIRLIFDKRHKYDFQDEYIFELIELGFRYQKAEKN